MKGKTKTISLILHCILLYGCAIEKDNNDLTRENIEGQVRIIFATEYNAVERFGEFRKFDSSSFLFKMDSKYDDWGNETEHNFYNDDGSLLDKVKFKYEGNRKSGSQYTNDGILSSKSTYEYDNSANLTVVNWYKPDGSSIVKYTIKYDSKKNKVEEENYNADGNLTSKSRFKYDTKRNVIERIDSASDGSLSKTTYQYDKYDKKGNWLRKIENKVDSDLDVIIERKIEYW